MVNRIRSILRRWKWRNKHADALRNKASSGHLDKHERNKIFESRKKLPK